MDEFIYSIKDIFDKVLTEKSVDCYYIPTYQRGYKWDSSTRYGQVPQMLIDVYYAFKQNVEEYYLQFITVKKDKESRFEVIDGQQRLTTLSLLLYRYTKLYDKENIAAHKVNYSRYRDYNIFEWVNDNIDDIEDIDAVDSQDKFYMLKAAKCIDNFFDNFEGEDSDNEKSEYIEYLLKNVKLILNEESEFVNSEETFANLNDNKVPLTDTYLIKGLLLTLSTRFVSGGQRQTYREIMDQRSIMGRTWDEIQSWIEQPKVAHYFFGKKSDGGMKSLLQLVEYIYLHDGKQQDVTEQIETFIDGFEGTFTTTGDKRNEELELFNRYNEAVKDEAKAQEVLSHIKHIYRVFRNIYDNVEDGRLYNKIGYILFSNNHIADSEKERKEFFRTIITADKSTLNKFLSDKLRDIIPIIDNSNLSNFNYKNSNPELKKLLLSFSVFPENAAKTYRFNFYQYDNNNWSFEHIYPQNPKGKVKIHKSAVPLVRQEIEKRKNKEISDWEEQKAKAIAEDIEKHNKIIEGYDDILDTLAKGCGLESGSIDFLYSEPLDNEDACGNMALLSCGANSALSNNPYLCKRPILYELESSGYFVPHHTMQIFNKSLMPVNGKALNPNLMEWTQADVDAHTEWMIKRNKEIRDNL